MVAEISFRKHIFIGVQLPGIHGKCASSLLWNNLEHVQGWQV